MNCEYCGAAIPPGAGNCPSCGAAVTVQVSPPVQVAQPTPAPQPYAPPPGYPAPPPGYPAPQPGYPAPQPGYPFQPQVALGQRARVVYIMLGIFFGIFGIHNFYANRAAPGLGQLLVTIFLGWLGYPLLLVWIWAIVECCTIKADGRGTPFD